MTLSIICAALIFSIPGAYLIARGNNGTHSATELHNSAAIFARKTRDRSGVRSRLEELGLINESDYENFRIRQALYCLASSVITIFVLLFLGKPFMSSIILSIVIAIILYFYMDRELSMKVKKFRVQLESEFPAIIEMLTLAISAGETPLTAIMRISQSASGQLPQEFARVVSEVKAGSSLNIALDSMGRRIKSVLIRRFVDALVTATLRGAPLVEVLTRHASEARSVQRNRVLSAAGKAEISMMIPVIFLILPISILFALWPSLANLNLFAG
jgi:tight adherence protein C